MFWWDQYDDTDAVITEDCLMSDEGVPSRGPCAHADALWVRERERERERKKGALTHTQHAHSQVTQEGTILILTKGRNTQKTSQNSLFFTERRAD